MAGQASGCGRSRCDSRVIRGFRSVRAPGASIAASLLAVQGIGGGRQQLAVSVQRQGRVGSDDDDQIVRAPVSAGQIAPAQAEGLTQQTLDPVATDRGPDAPGDGQSQSRFCQGVGAGEHDERPGRLPQPVRVDSLELADVGEAVPATEGKASGLCRWSAWV